MLPRYRRLAPPSGEEVPLPPPYVSVVYVFEFYSVRCDSLAEVPKGYFDSYDVRVLSSTIVRYSASVGVVVNVVDVVGVPGAVKVLEPYSVSVSSSTSVSVVAPIVVSVLDSYSASALSSTSVSTPAGVVYSASVGVGLGVSDTSSVPSVYSASVGVGLSVSDTSSISGVYSVSVGVGLGAGDSSSVY